MEGVCWLLVADEDNHMGGRGFPSPHACDQREAEYVSPRSEVQQGDIYGTLGARTNGV